MNSLPALDRYLGRSPFFREARAGDALNRSRSSANISNMIYTSIMSTRQKTIRCGALTRELRLRHRIDQAELARRAGTTQPAVSRIERDQVSPTLETVNRLFAALGEAVVVSPVSLHEPPPGGGNQSIAELRSDYIELTPEERLEQAAHLSEVATELAAGATA